MKKTIITTSMLALFAGAVFAESYVFDSSNPNGFIPLESGSLEMTINDGAKLATIHTTSATGVVDNVSIVLNGGSTGIIWGAGKGVVSGDVNMTLNHSGSTGAVMSAGGTYGSVVKGNTYLTIEQGSYTSHVSGGGYGSIVEGNSTVTINGGSVGTLLGGDYNGGVVKGKTTININGGSVGTIYAGSLFSAPAENPYTTTPNGAIELNITGGTINHIRGGNNCSYDAPVDVIAHWKVKGDININISGNAVILGDSSGEAIIAGGARNNVEGNVTVSVSENATINGILAVGSSRGGDGGGVMGNTTLNVSGGTINGDIYAGALKHAVVEGSSNVNISGGTITSNIYLGGGSNSFVKSGGTITISGDAVITGAISGNGASGGVVEGDKNLVVKDYEVVNASLNATDFNTLSVENSSVTLVNALVLDSIAIDADSSVALAEGSSIGSYIFIIDNASQGDSFDLATFDNVLSIGEEGVVLSAMEFDASDLKVRDANGNLYAVNFDQANGYTVGANIAVPEPAEWAMIFGVLALGLAMYRRRK